MTNKFIGVREVNKEIFHKFKTKAIEEKMKYISTFDKEFSKINEINIIN